MSRPQPKSFGVLSMAPCPQCKGKKKITLTVSGGGENCIMMLPCPSCHGRGLVTEEARVAIESFWCECPGGAESKDIEYFENGQHPACWTHHYRHVICGRVVQVG